MRPAPHTAAFLLSLWAWCTVVQAQAPANQVTGVYTCVDAQGKRHTADRPIAHCQDREQRVLGPSGAELKRIGPALSEAEIAQQQEARRQDRLAQQRQQEQRRRDAALLARYPSRDLHDQARQESLSQVEELQGIALQRLKELQAQLHSIQQELEFYASKPQDIPPRLRLAQQDAQRSVAEQERFMQAQQADKQRIHSRFDAELQRLQPLWGGNSRALPQD